MVGAQDAYRGMAPKNEARQLKDGVLVDTEREMLQREQSEGANYTLVYLLASFLPTAVFQNVIFAWWGPQFFLPPTLTRRACAGAGCLARCTPRPTCSTITSGPPPRSL